MKRFKKGDSVIITTGKSKGHVGEIKKVSGDKLMVEGGNLVKKHEKPNPQINKQGGIVSKEAFIHVSNVAHYNPQSKRADKVGFKLVEQGDKNIKVRYFKSDNEIVDRI